MSDHPKSTTSAGVADGHGMSDDELTAIRERADAATPGPWAWAQTAEKDYGASVGARCFAEHDTACRWPLSGDLSERTDDYYVDENVAEMSHQGAAPDAAFIAHARTDIPLLLSALHSRTRTAERAGGVTDEMVERAAIAMVEWDDEHDPVYRGIGPWASLIDHSREHYRLAARRALTAALGPEVPV